MTEHLVDTFDGCVHALKQNDLKQSLYDAAAIMMDRVLVNLHGAEHRARRNQEALVFRKDIFLMYEKTILPRTLEETMAPFIEAGRGDLVDIGYRVMMNLTVDFTGIDRPERSAEETADLLRLLRAFSLAPALGQSLKDDADEKRAIIKDAMAEFDKRYLKPSLDKRRQYRAKLEAGEITKDDLPKDVLMMLVMGQEKLEMSELDLLKEGIFYSLAGAHTTIHTLGHTINEIFEWLDAHPQDKQRFQDDPFFFQQCTFEALRLHPSSPVAKRRALCPVDLGGEQAQEGEEVVVNLHAANRNSEIFGADADRFNPHRSVPKGYFPYGLSMGHGMHACLGRNLAVGVVPKDGADPEGHQYGTVPLIVEALLKMGVQRDPDAAPKKDEGITRITFAQYPVLFKPDEALIEP